MTAQTALTISFSKQPRPGTSIAVVFATDGRKLGPAAKALDKQSGGLLQAAVKNAAKFDGKAGEILSVTLPEKSGFTQAYVLGLGKPETLDAQAVENLGGKLYAALGGTGHEKIAVMIEALPGLKKIKDNELAAHLAAGALYRSYKFERYKTKSKDAPKTLTLLQFTGENAARAAPLFDALNHTIEGVFTARDLVNEPPNVIYPEALADFIVSTLKPLGVEVTVLDEKKMEKLGMGAILAVGMGSERKPRMVMMEWKGGSKSAKSAKAGPIALVGKGVTFDTGGISIKPGAGMEEMKMDMGGAAAVIGTMQALALRKSTAHVIGVVGLAENMPSGNAYRPADILHSLSGKTIEVLNTDAEGRLVLADCLTHVQRTYKPHTIIDLATLTGAMMVALGYEYCGTFANDDKLWTQLESASKETGEKLWRMPLDEVWRKEMESPVADLQNLAQTGRYAGGCTAAGFLEHFIDNGVNWAHMDIAGTAWIKKDRPTIPKYGTGFGVRVLDRLIADNYEK